MASMHTPNGWRAFRASLTPDPQLIHFHLDADGRAFVCDIDQCDSAALSLSEASWSAATRSAGWRNREASQQDAWSCV